MTTALKDLHRRRGDYEMVVLRGVVIPNDQGTRAPRGYLAGCLMALVVVATSQVVTVDFASAQTVGPAVSAEAAKPKAKAPAKAAAKAAPAADDDGSAEQKKDPNEAQKHVDNGIKLLQGGKVDAAVHTFSSVIGAGKLPATVMARALYNRGLAYRKQGKPAQAISDLTSALWLKGGLTDAERADALSSRVAAYREAGLSDQSTGEDATAAADNKVSATRSKTLDQGKALTTQSVGSNGTPTAGLAPQSTVTTNETTNPLASLFGGLFGGASSAPEAPTDAPRAAPKVAAPIPAPIPPSYAPAAGPAVASAPVAAKTAAKAPAQKPVTVAAATVVAPVAHAVGATHRAQVALVRSKAEADTLVQKLKGQLPSAVGNREPSVDQVTLGGMGAFFRVRLGPFATQAEAQAACTSLKTSGLGDCVPVIQ
jgi:tetratricopeptide (TPR) repeat protein